ncbi:MAG: GNAT family N-acetyltransferase [Phycisphaeraceae bacterium]
MRVRRGTPQDSDAIAAFDCFGGDRPAALEAGRCLVAEIDGRVAGFVVYAKHGLIGRDFVEYLVVHETFRRRGVAAMLLDAVGERVGPGRLFISTESGNTPMRTLLAKQGWTPAGHLSGANRSGCDELFFYRDVSGA